nr:MAG TPA: hypothetical protein [Caudoviricetes sp.]
MSLVRELKFERDNEINKKSPLDVGAPNGERDMYKIHTTVTVFYHILTKKSIGVIK